MNNDLNKKFLYTDENGVVHCGDINYNDILNTPSIPHDAISQYTGTEQSVINPAISSLNLNYFRFIHTSDWDNYSLWFKGGNTYKIRVLTDLDAPFKMSCNDFFEMWKYFIYDGGNTYQNMFVDNSQFLENDSEVILTRLPDDLYNLKAKVSFTTSRFNNPGSRAGLFFKKSFFRWIFDEELNTGWNYDVNGKFVCEVNGVKVTSRIHIVDTTNMTASQLIYDKYMILFDVPSEVLGQDNVSYVLYLNIIIKKEIV